MSAKASSGSSNYLAILTSFLSVDRERKKQIPIGPSVKVVPGVPVS